MAEKLDISQALFSNKSPIPFLVQSGARISTVGMEGSVEEGLCDTHKNLTTDKRHKAKLSTAALILNAMIEGDISCAVGRHKEVYGEINTAGSCFKFQYDGATIHYAQAAAPGKYQIAPIVIYAIFNNSEVEKYFDAAISNRSLETVFAFCDSFWYDYAKKQPNEVSFATDLAIETIKAAYSNGALTDKSDKVLGMPCSEFQSLNLRNPTVSIVPPDISEFSEIMHGKHLIAHDWDASQESKIRPLDYLRGYVPTKTFFKVMRKLDKRIGQNMVDYYNLGINDVFVLQEDMVDLLFWGEPGTGKTALANALSAATGMPLYEVITNEDSEDDVYEGRNKIVNGQLGFVETAFLEAFTNGGILLLEEVNLSRPNVATSALNQAMEYPYMLNRNGYERITRNPFAIIIGTMNPDAEGTMTLNSSTAQRFVHKYEITDPTDAEFIKIIKAKGHSEKDAYYAYGAYKKIRDYLKISPQTKKYLKELSIRQCFGAINSIEEGENPTVAITDTMCNAIAIVNKKLADTVQKTIINTLPDYMAS